MHQIIDFLTGISLLYLFYDLGMTQRRQASKAETLSLYDENPFIS
jgi:hypothetical protein